MGAFGHGFGDELVNRVKQELSVSPSANLEFPISSMSLSLARSIGQLRTRRGGAALDVGTGCGIHAFLLNRAGFQSVVAIDSNARAVELACARALRLGLACSLVGIEKLAHLSQEDAAAPSHISFVTVPLEELAALLEYRFQAIVFNPPGYFFVRSADLSSPAASGVYTGEAGGAMKVKDSPLFRFFERVVLPLLAPGGEVLCTWPGLERRAVETDPSTAKPGRVAHPADLLESGSILRSTRRKETRKNSSASRR